MDDALHALQLGRPLPSLDVLDARGAGADFKALLGKGRFLCLFFFRGHW